ncbi:MAG: hypothetical protein ACI9WR_001307, partial [Paracoccaceae bacterium]
SIELLTPFSLRLRWNSPTNSIGCEARQQFCISL